jgi:hypothetical protein
MKIPYTPEEKRNKKAMRKFQQKLEMAISKKCSKCGNNANNQQNKQHKKTLKKLDVITCKCKKCGRYL